MTRPARSLADQLRRHARVRPEAAAFHVLEPSGVTTLTWSGLLDAARCHRDRYRAAGVLPGDTVLLSLRHGSSAYPAFVGAMLTGAVPGFLAFPSAKQDAGLFWTTHAALLERIRPPVVVTYSGIAETVRAVVPFGTEVLLDEPLLTHTTRDDDEPVPDEGAVALVQHSSGTTGLKKTVALSHAQIADQVAAYAQVLALAPDDLVASWLPLYHDMGLVTAFLLPVIKGLTTVSLDPFVWSENPQLLLEAMDTYQATHAWLPNFAFRHLVRTRAPGRQFRLDHVRALVSCSEPCRPETLEEFARAFADRGVRPDQLRTCYAMAETVFAVSQSAPGVPPRSLHLDARALSRGRAVQVPPSVGWAVLSTGNPLPGAEVRVGPGHGSESAAGKGSAEGNMVGELEVRAPWLFGGYAGGEQSGETFTSDGWYRTGDLGALVEGEVVVLGRKGEVIVHHGVNYYAHDVEAAADVPGVRPGRVVALGRHDPETGSNEVELVAERAPGSDLVDVDVIAALRRAVARMLPLSVGRVHLVEPGWLVKSTSGKISRSENLAKLERGTIAVPGLTVSAEGDGGRSDTRLEETVLAVIAETFAVERGTLGLWTAAADVEGWDSLGHTVLMIRLGRVLGIAVPESVASQSLTVGDLVERIAGLEIHRDAW